MRRGTGSALALCALARAGREGLVALKRKWNAEEDGLVTSRAAQGATIEDVAAELGRSVVAVSGRATLLGVTLYSRGARNRRRESPSEPAGDVVEDWLPRMDQ